MEARAILRPRRVTRASGPAGSAASVVTGRRFGRIDARRALGAVRASSSDVVAGALCGGAWAAAVCRSTLPGVWWVVLGLGVWVGYTVDHLLDAAKPRRADEAPRHRFHRTHRRALLGAVALAVVAIVIVGIGALPAVAVPIGLGLGIAVVVHAWIAQGPRRGAASGVRAAIERVTVVPKEVSAAVVYTAGCWALPAAIASGTHPLRWGTVAALHGLAAVANLAGNSWFDRAADAHGDRRAAAVRFGAARLRRAIRILGGVGAAFGIATALVGVALGDRVLVASGGVAAVLIAFPAIAVSRAERFGRGRYRPWGDALFLATLVPWIVA